MAKERDFLTVSVEAHENKSLPVLLLPHLRGLLIKLNSYERISTVARKGLRMFKSFASGFKTKISLHDSSLSWELNPRKAWQTAATSSMTLGSSW